MTSAYRFLLGPILPVPQTVWASTTVSPAYPSGDGWVTARAAVRRIQHLLFHTLIPSSAASLSQGQGPLRTDVGHVRDWHQDNEHIMDAISMSTVTLTYGDDTPNRIGADSPPEITWCAFGFATIGHQRAFIIRFSATAFGQHAQTWCFFPISERSDTLQARHPDLFYTRWVDCVYSALSAFLSSFTVEAAHGSFQTIDDVRRYMSTVWRRTTAEFMARFGIGHLSEEEARVSSLARALLHLDLGNTSFNLSAIG